MMNHFTHTSDYAHLNILIVDNHSADRTSAMNLVKQNGHFARVSSNLTNTLSEIAKYPYDLIFLDLYLPEMSGFEATKQVLDWYAQNQRNPATIMALTKTEDPNDVRKCFEAGMKNFMLKPLHEASFQAAIHFHLYKKQNVI